jgi:tetratricopeptide (TPR) repeat protein
MTPDSNPELLVRLAGQDLEKEDLAAAEAKCLRALDIDREYAGGWIVLGMILQARGRHDEAVRVFNSLALKDPGSAEHWSNLGVALRSAKRVDEALAAFERAIALSPPPARTLLNLGLVHSARLNYAAARAVLSRAAEMAPTDAWIRCALAQCCYDLGDFDQALRTLEHWPRFDGLTAASLAEIAYLLIMMGERERAEPAIEWLRANPPTGGRPALTLVNVLERINQLDAARSGLGRLKGVMTAAEQADPDFLLAQVVLAQRDDRHEEARRLLSSALESQADFVRSHALLFPLAQSLDALGLYDEAIATLAEAHRSQAAYLEAALGKTPADASPTLSLTQRGIDPEERGSWDDSGAPARADSPIFVVGFPRSGTTLLEQTLDAHPSLVSMDEQPALRKAVDQVASFDIAYPAQLGKLSAAQLQRIRAQYWKQVDQKIRLHPGQRLVDKNPFNMLRLPLIRRLFPNAQTVLIVRHPCDVLLSCYMQYFRAPDLAMLCRDLPTLADAHRRSFDFWYAQLPLAGAATYELRYESFVADFPAEVTKLAQFLELSWSDAMLAPAEHARAKGFISTPSYTQVIEPVSPKPIGRWRHYERHFRDVLATLEPYLGRWGYACEGAEGS